MQTHTHKHTHTLAHIHTYTHAYSHTHTHICILHTRHSSSRGCSQSGMRPCTDQSWSSQVVKGHSHPRLQHPASPMAMQPSEDLRSPPPAISDRPRSVSSQVGVGVMPSVITYALSCLVSGCLSFCNAKSPSEGCAWPRRTVPGKGRLCLAKSNCAWQG